VAQLGLIVIGAALAVGGVCALAGVGVTKRKTSPGVAVAMIVVGLVTVGVALFGLGPLTNLFRF
jgi:hypothetical protein